MSAIMPIYYLRCFKQNHFLKCVTENAIVIEIIRELLLKKDVKTI